jgi:large subunit ribosomal protein L5
MADKGKSGGAKGGAGAKGGGAKGGKGGAGAKGGGQSKSGTAKAERGKGGVDFTKRQHAGAGLPTTAPRLKLHYEAVVRAKLMAQFGLTNVHQVPVLSKVVLNVGFGEAVKNAKALDGIVEELALISGQKPVRRKARKSIANYGLREGQEIGVSVTLRGTRMWEFFDRFVTVASPRIRDFRGFGTRQFDGRGNYTLGVKEQTIFPEIEYDQIDQIHGMDITFVTTATRDDHALALLRGLGMPFRGEEKPMVPKVAQLGAAA